MSAQEFYDKFHDQVLIIHAHPFRKGSAPVQETAVHGAEIINGNPRHENNNDKAWSCACAIRSTTAWPGPTPTGTRTRPGPA